MACRCIALLFVLLGLAVQPVFAHDSVGGRPDLTITVTSRLSDRDVHVGVGSIVRFRNADSENHRFRSRSGRGFDTGDIQPGEFAQIRVGTAGTYVFTDERTDDARYAGRIVVGGSSAPSTSSTESTSTPRRTAAVTIGDRIFQPSTTRIAAGGSVTFRNADRDAHTVTGGIIDSGTLNPGATYRQTFAQPGSYDFLCQFHPDMRGTIEVVGAAKPAISSTPPPPTPTPTPKPSSAPAGVAAVDIVDLVFEPASLEVPAGTTVKWTNTGVAPHTATAKEGTFDSGTLQTGGTFDHTFTTPGRYAYQCLIHPDMTGSIAVTGTAVAAVAAPVSSESTPPASPPSATIDPGATTDMSSLGGIGLAVLLISIASALFARLLRGTVRA